MERLQNQRLLLSGNEAIAHGAKAAGVRFASAYPGTPSTEILENIAKFPGIHAQWSPNEKVAFEVGIGASLGGARTIVCMKHVGVNVAADPLMTFAYTGVKGGFVLVSADDPEMHSSQNEQDNRAYAKFAKIPMLEPSDSQECYDFVEETLNISEQFDTPVLLRCTTRISHSLTAVKVRSWKDVPVKGFEVDIAKYVMMPNWAKPRHQAVLKRLEALKKFTEETPLNRIEWGDRKIGIVTSGVSYQHSKEVMPEASFFKLGLSYPMPLKRLKEFASKVERIIVVEELEPFIEEALKIEGIACEGKKLFPIFGELNPTLVQKGLADAGLAPKPSLDTTLPVQVLPRPPVLCPGCGHRSVFYALRRMGAHVLGDIGCYTLAALPPLEAVHSCVAMGASIGMAAGAAHAGYRPAVAAIGDSTFAHGGITPLLSAVQQGVNLKVIVLDNGTVGMTGTQRSMSTGDILDQIILGAGVAPDHLRIIEPTPANHAANVQILRDELAWEGTSVIIARRTCLEAIKRRAS